jgi:hypothetical protein
VGEGEELRAHRGGAETRRKPGPSRNCP